MLLLLLLRSMMMMLRQARGDAAVCVGVRWVGDAAALWATWRAPGNF